MIRRVMSYDTGGVLRGSPSEALCEASDDDTANGTGTGAVSAYRDSAGMWRYVPSSEKEHYRKHERVDVITVYVEAA